MRHLALLLLVACGGSSPSTQPTFWANVRTQTLQIGGRPVTLFVPGFKYDPAKAYFLVLNDGQDVAQLRFPGALSELWTQGQVAPLIVIAVPAVDRLQQYGTTEHDVAIACNTQGQQLGTKAADYQKFVLQEVLPAVAHAVGFRPPAARTGFLGASLGGLSAFSIAWDHPEAFGFAGVMSGSFWWRTDESSLQARQDTRIMQNIVGRSAPHPGFRAWLEAGTQDETADRDNNGIIDAIDDTLWLMKKLDGVGLVRDRDYTYLQVTGGTHDYGTWAGVLPQFLTWAAPP